MLLVATQSGIRIDGNLVYDDEQYEGYFYSLEEALAAKLVAYVPAQYRLCVFDHTGEEKCLWHDEATEEILEELIGDGVYPYLHIEDYISREHRLYLPAETPRGVFPKTWKLNEILGMFFNEFEIHSGVPHRRALVVAGPSCINCGRRNLPLTAWQVCPRCIASTARHTPECFIAWIAQVRDLEAYRRQWPFACLSCSESGVKHYFSNSYFEPDEDDACPRCAEKDHCPRCGRAGLPDPDDEIVAGPCKFCRWKPGYEFRTMPRVEFECWCHRGKIECAELSWESPLDDDADRWERQ